MENDYGNPEHKKYIDDAMISQEFKNIYRSGNGWNFVGNFYEVWVR